MLRELVAVTETGTDLDRAWAQQAIDALLTLDKAAETARADGAAVIDQQVLDEHEGWYRKAAAAGIALENAAVTGNCSKEAARPREEDEGPGGRLPAVRP